jgi:pimeloyl-ACP methyl ester carboxylesterase
VAYTSVLRLVKQLARHRMLVRYDIRGIALSEPVEPSFGLESHILDLQAVIDHLGLENFALLAPQHAGPAAITYAARHMKGYHIYYCG